MQVNLDDQSKKTGLIILNNLLVSRGFKPLILEKIVYPATGILGPDAI